MKKMGNTRFGLFGVGATVTLLLTSFVLIAPTADASEPPMVTAWSPVGMDISVNDAINVALSKPMNTTSVEQSPRYNDGGIVRDWKHGSFTWTGNVSFVFTPDEPYACCTQYNVTLLSSTAKDEVSYSRCGVSPVLSWVSPQCLVSPV